MKLLRDATEGKRQPNEKEMLRAPSRFPFPVDRLAAVGLRIHGQTNR